MPQNAIIRANGTGDYTTIIAWEAAEQSSDYGTITVGRVDGFFDAGASQTIISGTWPNGARLEPFDPADAFDGTERSLCGLTSTASITLRNTGKKVEFEGLEVYNTGTGRAYNNTTNGGDLSFTLGLAKSDTGDAVNNNSSVGVGFVDSVVVSENGNPHRDGVFNRCNIFGNTAAAIGTGSTNSTSNTVTVNSDTGACYRNSVTQSNNASSDATADTLDNIVIADNFESATPVASGDYRIKATSDLDTNGIGSFVSSGSGISVTALLNSNYMIEYNMKKNVASQSIGAQMITIADGSNFTGSVAVEVTIDGGTKTTGGGSVTHEGEGYHSYALTQAETNGNHIAVSFAGTGALTQTIQVYTSFPQTVDNNTKISLIPTTAMRGTDSANTVVPPSVAQFNARTIVSADYFLVTDYTAPDNASITSILADTNELQTSQGNWLTATGFSTSAEIAALNDISVTDILTTQMTESYAGDGTAPTLAQSLFLTMQNLQDFSYAGTTQTVKRLDGSTIAATYTLNDAVTPTSKTRAS